MHQITHRILILFLMCILTLTTRVVYCEQYVTVDRENGDRLTGIFIGATDTHFEIEYNKQVLRFPLQGNMLTFHSNIENVPDQSAKRYYRKGLDLLDLQLPDSAKSAFELAIQETPKYVDAHYQLGLLYKNEGNTERALLHFKSVLLIDSQKYDLVPILQEIAESAVAVEDYTQTVNAYQLLIKHYPEHQAIASISYKTGFILVEELEDTETGLELLINSSNKYSTSPEQEKAIFLIGGIQADSGDLDTALKTFQRFIRIYQDSIWVNEALLKQAAIYLQLGNRKNAVDIANLLLRQNPDDHSIVEQAKEIVRASVWKIYTDFLPDLNIQAIAIDRTSLWIGTPKGIAQIETNGRGEWRAIEAAAWMINTFTQTVPDVRSIAVNENGIWVGSRNQGVIHYNKRTNKVDNYPIADGLTWIRDIEMDAKDIWFATEQGVVQEDIESGKQYHYHELNEPVPNDIHSIALTAEVVWVGTSGSNIAVFNREDRIWTPHFFHDIKQETNIVKFDALEGKIMFSWYNDEDRNNGIFHANLDGTNGRSSSISGVSENSDVLINNIYVTGFLDTTQLELENGEPNSQSETLWIADNDYITIYYPIDDDFAGTIGYPKIVLEDLSVECIVVDNERAWIGTSKGMLTIEKDKVTQLRE